MSCSANREKFSYPSQECAVLRQAADIIGGYTSFENHSKNVTAVRCSPQGDRVLSADETGYVFVWNANHPELLVSWEFQGSTGSIYDASFTDDGEKAGRKSVGTAESTEPERAQSGERA